MDSYDDVRGLAVGILRTFEPQLLVPDRQALAALISHAKSAFKHAEDAARGTGRASLADGFGRLYELRFERWSILNQHSEDHLRLFEGLLEALESDISQAENDLSVAVMKAPIFARFLALRLISSTLSLDPC